MKKTCLILLFPLICLACRPGADLKEGIPVVSVSILPQQYFIERIAGDLVQVNVLIPPGASPATYEPTLAQLEQLGKSELYMKMGYLGFELGWMEKIVSVNPDMKIADLSGGISLISGTGDEDAHGHAHGTDPHIWMSVTNARIMAGTICASLHTLLPAEQGTLEHNYSAFLLALDSLDRMIRDTLSGLEHRTFIIYHPSLSYFARDYGLEQLPLELEGKEPSPAHMQLMSGLGQEQHIRAILLQKQFDQKNARALAAEIGAEIIVIDPLDPEWFEQMLHISSQLKSALQ
jgi:zinc transport system substrate-binding protein